jgi:hypothetical protein
MTNKTKGELRAEIMKQQGAKSKEKITAEFLKEYREAVTPIQEKYKRCLVPGIKWADTGAHPVFLVDLYIPQNNEETNKSETIERADSDDKTPQE